MSDMGEIRQRDDGKEYTCTKCGPDNVILGWIQNGHYGCRTCNANDPCEPYTTDRTMEGAAETLQRTLEFHDALGTKEAQALRTLYKPGDDTDAARWRHGYATLNCPECKTIVQEIRDLNLETCTVDDLCRDSKLLGRLVRHVRETGHAILIRHP